MWLQVRRLVVRKQEKGSKCYKMNMSEGDMLFCLLRAGMD